MSRMGRPAVYRKVMDKAFSYVRLILFATDECNKVKGLTFYNFYLTMLVTSKSLHNTHI